MNYIKDWGRRLKNIFQLVKFIELKDGVYLFYIWVKNAFFSPNKGLEIFDSKKIYFIEKWLTKKYDYLIPESFNEFNTCDDDINKNDEAIWVFWYQGEESMPEIVKLCYKSICINSNGHPVYLLTKDNIINYINIPDYIWKLVESGSMTYTHLSDILRINLLYKYGGLWMDSTLFVTAPIVTDRFGSLFYSIKNKPHVKGTISNYRWASFFLYARKGSLAFKVFRDLFYIYTKENSTMIDYFLIDYFFDLLYKKNEVFRKEVDSIPCTNPELHFLIGELNNPYNSDIFKKYLSETSVFKFNYRHKLIIQTNKQTLYSYLTKTYLHN